MRVRVNQIKEYIETIFESIKHINDFRNEYWFIRELMAALEYIKCGNFEKNIKKQNLHVN